MKAILGRKIGMTQIFDENGAVIPVTVIQSGAMVITQVKTVEKDGYNAIQVGFEDTKEKSLNKPQKGHQAKAGVVKKFVREFRVEDVAGYNIGDTLDVSVLEGVSKLDATATSKGKGFQGVIKRHGQSRGPETHGSRYHRRPGSMGACSDPSRVFKGKALPGQMGNVTVTIQNLELVKIDKDKNIILVKGAVPGPKKGLVTIQEAVKSSK